jgi:hypothetical protein
MKEIWANPQDYPKELVYKLNGGKVRWKNVQDADTQTQAKKRKHSGQILDTKQVNIAD